MKRLYLQNVKLLIFIGIALLAITTVAVVNVNLSMQNNSLSTISLAKANVEALAQEINYYVPDKSNDPKTCTMTIYFAAGAEITVGNYATSAGYYNVSGIVNTCRNGSAGCDTYNCHRRVN
jgi:hypothetical protein